MAPLMASRSTGQISSITQLGAYMMVGPRNGLLGSWDRLVGPGMSRGETLLVLAASVSGLVFAGILMSSSGASLLLVGLSALIGFDVVGGAVCNGTPDNACLAPSARPDLGSTRWIHRPTFGVCDCRRRFSARAGVRQQLRLGLRLGPCWRCCGHPLHARAAENPGRVLGLSCRPVRGHNRRETNTRDGMV